MKITNISPRLRIIIAAIFIAVSVFAYGLHQYSYAQRLAQRQEQERSIVNLFGPDGRNVRNAGQTADMMGQSLSDRIDQVTIQCNKMKVTDQERTRLLVATYNAGKAAMDKVVASKYTAPFEPHYPPLPE